MPAATRPNQPIPVPNPVASFINRVALDPILLTAFRTDAEALFDDSLSPRDQRAIASGDVGAIRMAIKGSVHATAAEQGDPIETTEVTEVTDTPVVVVVEEGAPPEPGRLGDSDPVETVTEVVTEVEVTDVADTDVVDVIEMIVEAEVPEGGDGEPTRKG